jgi:hypothetical protein
MTKVGYTTNDVKFIYNYIRDNPMSKMMPCSGKRFSKLRMKKVYTLLLYLRVISKHSDGRIKKYIVNGGY